MSAQPEALRLEDALDVFAALDGGDLADVKNGADKLRRQHAEAERMSEINRQLVDKANQLTVMSARDEEKMGRLKALNAELLEALRLAYRHLNGGADSLSAMEHAEAHRLARAAIQKATGGQP